MQYDLEVDGRQRRVVLRRSGDGFAVELDGRNYLVDAVRVDPYTVSLLVAPLTHHSSLGGGRSYQVSVAPGIAGRSVAFVESAAVGVAVDGRSRRADGGTHANEGRKRITAPMPGKVVRVLVAKGDTVQARQPLVVVEAMKMENELRASSDGTVGEVHVSPGASVEAGTPLIDIL